MEVMLLGIVIESNFLQLAKAFSSIEITSSPKTTSLIFELENQLPTVAQWMVTDERLVHKSKALYPIEVTFLPIVIEVNPLQPEKVLIPMEVTLLGISIDVNFQQL